MRPRSSSINLSFCRAYYINIFNFTHDLIDLRCLYDNKMAPPFPESKITLDYPLYGCDFDPQDSSRLFVGGGGGASRTGVGNKISFLDVSSREKIERAGEISLSKDEDNVVNLVAGQRRGSKATLLYAGINSSPENQQKGKNEHFRVFSAEPAAKSRSVMGARIAELSRSSLFTTKSEDTYQRLLRVTQPFSGVSQFGAIATGLAKEAQIALFDVAAGNHAPSPRGVLDLNKEAVDLDVIQTGEGTYQLMYCDNHSLYTLDVTKAGASSAEFEPKCIYTMPTDDIRPTFRCIRYLTPNFIAAVANLPRPGGIILYGFRLPKAGNSETPARIAVNAKLPKRAGAKATGLAVANLSPVSTPGSKQGDAQFVIAVASNDFSIHLYTLDHQVVGTIDALANLFPLRELKNVQPAMITNLCFSHFVPPKAGTARVQYLKLASTSVSNSAVVHSIALKKTFDRPAKIKRGGPPRHPRFVVEAKSQAPSMTGLMLGFAIVALLLSVLFQGVLEIKGFSKPVVGGHNWLPSSWHAVPASPPVPHSGFLTRLLEEQKIARRDGVVLLDSQVPGEIKVVEENDGSAKAWHDLSPEQRELWKARLTKNGHWADNMGEKIFKGVLFGELAGVVAGIVGG